MCEAWLSDILDSYYESKGEYYDYEEDYEK